MKPAIEAYRKKEKTLHRGFNELVRKHATHTFGCDESCLSTCLDDITLISFWHVPKCLKHCRCTFGKVLEIEETNVSAFAAEDPEGWRFYIRNRDRFIE